MSQRGRAPDQVQPLNRRLQTEEKVFCVTKAAYKGTYLCMCACVCARERVTGLMTLSDLARRAMSLAYIRIENLTPPPPTHPAFFFL